MTDRNRADAIEAKLNGAGNGNGGAAEQVNNENKSVASEATKSPRMPIAPKGSAAGVIKEEKKAMAPLYTNAGQPRKPLGTRK